MMIGYPLDQSQISRILGPKFDYLDSEYIRKDLLVMKERNRLSIRDWPDLKIVLFE